MTINEFLINTQKYWGEYEEIVRIAVIKFLSLFSDQTREELLNLCVLKFSRVNDKGFPLPPPDVAQLNGLIDTAILNAKKKHVKKLPAPEITPEERADIDSMLEKLARKKSISKPVPVDEKPGTPEDPIERMERLRKRQELLREQARELGVA